MIVYMIVHVLYSFIRNIDRLLKVSICKAISQLNLHMWTI